MNLTWKNIIRRSTEETPVSQKLDGRYYFHHDGIRYKFTWEKILGDIYYTVRNEDNEIVKIRKINREGKDKELWFL